MTFRTRGGKLPLLSGTRVNLCAVPRATATSYPNGTIGFAPQWYGSGGTGTTSLVTGATDGPLGITTYMRKTWTASPTSSNADAGFNHSKGIANGYPVTPGETYSASTYVRTNASGKNFNMTAFYCDASGASVAARSVGPLTVLSPNTWTRISHNFTVPAAAAYMSIVTYSSYGNADTVLWAPNDTLDGTACLVEKAGSVQPYFDGSIPSGASRDVRWLGTVNSSQSEEMVQVPLGVKQPDGSWLFLTPVRNRVNLAINPGGEGTSGWSSNNGTYWTASWDTTVKKSGAQSRKFVAATGQIGYSRTILSMYNTGGSGLLASPGKAYVGSVYYASNVAEGCVGRISYQYLDSAGNAISGYSATYSGYFPVSGDGSWSRIYINIPPAPAGTGIIRLGGTVEKNATNTTANDTVWADECLLEEGYDLLPWFSGASATDPDYTYAWSGTANASQSTATQR